YVPGADIVIDQAAVNCTVAVAAALAKVVIFAADPAGRPAGLLLETADMDLAATGLKTTAAAVTLRQGRTYWLGIRHSATATLSSWATTATPDINGGSPVTTLRKTLRRTVTYATPAPANFGFVATEIGSAAATAIWLRIA
ncbi:MAG: hypothetical protein U1D35_13715, partial [Paracoccaceae bacterium]|nr:hypothetical protein [Paracoccaceae bacterium]